MTKGKKIRFPDEKKWNEIIREYAELKKENTALKAALFKVAAGYICETCQRVDCPDRSSDLQNEVSSCTSFEFEPK